MKKGLTAVGGAITITTTMLGAGINFMPAAYASLGYINSMFCMMFVIFLTGLTLFTVGYSAHLNKSNTKSYSSIGYDFHMYLGYIVDFAIVFSQFFVGIVFQKYMVDLLILYLFNVKSGQKDYDTYRIGGLLVTSIILYGLSLLKDLSSLRFTSYLSVFSVFYLTLLMTFFNFYLKTDIQTGGFDAKNNKYGFGLQSIILGMCCQVNMVSVYSELLNKSAKGLIFISAVSSILGGMIYASVGFFGYKILGNSIGKEDIIKIFCDRNSLLNRALANENIFIRKSPQVAIVGAIFVLLGSFPLQLNPASNILMKIFGKKDERSRIMLVTGLFLSILFINFIPNLKLDTFMGICGGIFSNSISFFFPSLYYILSVRKINLISILSGLTILFSICVGIYIIYTILASS
ncbi:hypothetical protein NCER_101273 [Vairimorpha ceranae BRL01]|uniref:Amino acid transporter transmembrane domain-containing protein n=2 Tax=Vairimorpha ceranae TaxID=40302 RepID=C4V9M2_VAIC1|nr:amino acid permease [Vairimorpha ceranae]EEQ82076.1 hypothetical protein NCER_101273 [Vairimorpha ceranae BRL01]KKO74228.1 amino acid permease [Vairimorpha ceranae]